MFSMLRRGVATATIVAACGLTATTAAATERPWRDPGQPPGQRADELLAAMTFDQKVDVALGDLGAVADLGIQPLTWADGPTGIRTTGTTSFPSGQQLASTFNRPLARAYGEAIAREARGKGDNVWFGPAIDIARTPLAGRQPENLGEDPFLAGETAAEEITGAKAAHVVATLKHYVGNNQEWTRTGERFGPTPAHTPAVNDLVSERALQEIYEAPFRHADRRATADSVMCSYNRVNGVQACQDPSVLGALKAAGFQGYVVPDYIFAVRDQLAATLAGSDLPEIPGDPVTPPRTREMFTSGQVPAARLDDIVRRILFAQFDSGAFDDPVPAPADDVSTPEHADLAARVATEGMVLLKNARGALPLTNDAPRSIAVIGPSGDDAMYVTGGSAAVPPEAGKAVTPLAGIQARAGSGVQVTPAQGSLGDVPLPAIVPSDVLTPSEGSGSGLFGTYWSNGDFDGAPALQRVDPTVDVSTTPDGVDATWSARWTGTLTPSESGLYRFSLMGAGISKLYIDDQLVASGYREGQQFVAGPFYPMNGAARLTQGKAVDVRIEYTSKTQLFGAGLHFSWQPPSASPRIAAAADAARSADVAIVLANNALGEGMDRPNLSLPGDQDQLIDAVARANPRTIVVLNTGGAVLMPWLDDVSAVLQAWYPGQQFGTALARVLFGDADPGGRLPITFPASDEQGPAPASMPERYPGVNLDEHYDEGILVGYRWYDQTGQQPLFPFGAGLSYADFRIGPLHVKADRRSGEVFAWTKVWNRSDRAGSTVVQAYVSFPEQTGEPPRQLKGYEKVELGRRQHAKVAFRLSPADLEYYDEGQGKLTTAEGRYTLAVGTSSRDLADQEDFTIGKHNHGHGRR